MIPIRLPVCFSCLAIRPIPKLKFIIPKYCFYSSGPAPDLCNVFTRPLSQHSFNFTTSCSIIDVSSNVSFIHTRKALYSSKRINTPHNKSTNSEEVDKKVQEAKLKKPKKEVKVYITLHNIDNSMTVSTVEEARKIAERRNLKLVKLSDSDTKTGRAVYKLMTGAQYLKDDSDWAKTKSSKDKFIKGDKLLSLSSNTCEHDVLTKARMMKKWLGKRMEVRVVISGNVAAGENVYSIVEREIGGNGRIVQKRVKSQDIRFQIIPSKDTDENNKADPKSEKENTKL